MCADCELPIVPYNDTQSLDNNTQSIISFIQGAIEASTKTVTKNYEVPYWKKELNFLRKEIAGIKKKIRRTRNRSPTKNWYLKNQLKSLNKEYRKREKEVVPK